MSYYNIEYKIRTKFIPKIYDFDRAYNSTLENNPMLRGDICYKYSQCNYIVNNKDFIKIVCYLYKDIPSIRIKLLDLISTNDTFRDIIKLVYVKFKGCFLQVPTKEHTIESMPLFVYKNCNHITTIINNIYKYERV